MKRLYGAILLVGVLITSFHCQKEISRGGFVNPAIENKNPAPLTATLQGNIIDETGQPAAGVMIRVGDKMSFTDASGYFRVRKAALDKNSAVVTAEKYGYFKAFRSFTATTGANHVVIQLIKKTSAGTVNAVTGGDATLPNGAKISLPPNAIVRVSGDAAYTGNVHVYAAYIDPTANNIGQIVPGSFMADDKDGKRVTLASYGMLAVELESTGGEKLQIAAGAKATLTATIPSSIRATAPNSIALWYIDEKTGIWKEEGVAIKNGDTYTGEVAHFSFWNYDIAVPAVNVSLKLKTSKGTPIVHGSVRITAKNTPGQAYGYTDSLGQVGGLVPANQALLLEVLDPCNNPVYSQDIASLSQNTDLGTIAVNNPGSQYVLTIEGQLKNCSNQAVKQGYIIIGFDNTTRYISPDENGEFATSFITCSGGPSGFDILGVDDGAQQQSPVAHITLQTPVTNAGVITACGIQSTQYINYNLDGTDYSITSIASDSLLSYTYDVQGTMPFNTWISGVKTSEKKHMALTFAHDGATGTYPVYALSTQGFDSVMVQQPANVVLTKYAGVAGDFFEGTFTAKFTHINPAPVHTVSGSFRIRRQ